MCDELPEYLRLLKAFFFVLISYWYFEWLSMVEEYTITTTIQYNHNQSIYNHYNFVFLYSVVVHSASGSRTDQFHVQFLVYYRVPSRETWSSNVLPLCVVCVYNYICMYFYLCQLRSYTCTFIPIHDFSCTDHELTLYQILL